MSSSHSSTSINFQGKSGEQYRFQAWSLGTKFKTTGGIYIFTKRECTDRTFTSKASHRCLAIGQTANLAELGLTKAELAKLEKQGVNCICVLAVANATRRAEIEKDLIDGNEQWGGDLHYLFHTDVPPRAPVPAEEVTRGD